MKRTEPWHQLYLYSKIQTHWRFRDTIRVGYQFLSENTRNQNFIVGDILLILIAGLLLWFNFGTEYELTPHYFKYRGGPLKGEIPLEKITEIVEGKTVWIGLRPATARKGLILKYDIYNEIYISPLTNESFIKKILEFDSQIKVTSIKKGMP